MLSGRGFREVYNMAGGIKAWQGLTAQGPEEVGMGLIKGDEAPEEMAVLVHAMEEGMRSLYEQLSSRVEDEELKSLLQKLANVEEEHKKAVAAITRKYAKAEDAPSLDSAKGDILEGGMTTEEFLQANASSMGSAKDVLILSMMLEAQALDLYLRYAHRSEDAETKSLLMEMAAEEKTHLSWLGERLDERESAG